MKPLKEIIRDIPDFPKEGIVYKDITPLLKDRETFARTVDDISERYTECGVQCVSGIEARGFILGAAVAYRLGVGFVPIRKPGKLPYKTEAVEYDLEYGTDEVQIHIDGIEKGQKVLMVDDLLATGGTMAAGCKLIKKLGGDIVGCAFIIELAFLGGREKLPDYDLFSLIQYH